MLSMKATEWEFRKRAMVFGLIYGVSFAMYAFDPRNSTVEIANAFVRRWNAQLMQAMGQGLDATVGRLLLNPDTLARILFVAACVVLVFAALTRTWATAYLRADVVYASEVKSDALVADGPYRYVRNPLYFGNVLMASGMGAIMSGSGSAFVFVAMIVFCYRLIFREEAELAAPQGEGYAAYRKAVPRLWPALRPRIAKAGGRPRWAAGFRAEAWGWGVALSLVAFTITLKLLWFFVIYGVSSAVFLAEGVATWVSSRRRKGPSQPT